MAEYSSYREDAPVHLNATFDSYREAKALYDELHTWTPSGGWSEAAEEFFSALKDAGEPPHLH